MPWTDELAELLKFTEKARKRPEVAAFFDGLRAAEAAQDKLHAKKFQDLRASFARGLFNDASEQAITLLKAHPKHPVLLLVQAQCALEFKRLDEAAAHLYRAESAGVPDELMLEMKARFCSAGQDSARSARLKDELESMIAKKEETEHADRLTTQVAGTLTWAWAGALAGLCLGVVGLGACLLAGNNSDSFLFGFLALVGLAVLVVCIVWIRRNNKVLHEQRVYEGNA